LIAARNGYAGPMVTRADLNSHWRARGIDPDRCFYTGWPLGGIFEVGHLTPRVLGGTDDPDNLFPCLRAAKLAKMHRTAEEFLTFLDAGEPDLPIAV
jgi:hypothetical protein